MKRVAKMSILIQKKRINRQSKAGWITFLWMRIK